MFAESLMHVTDFFPSVAFHNTQGYEQVNNERTEAVTFNDHTQMRVITLGWKKSVFICVPYL